MEQPTVKDVFFHGDLAKKFGEHHRFAGDHVQTVMRGIELNHPGLRSFIANRYYHVRLKVKDRPLFELSSDTTDEVLGIRLGSEVEEIHIVPAVAGAGNEGKIFLGIGLLFIGLLSGGFGLAGGGLFAGQLSLGKLIFAGVLIAASEYLAPQPKIGEGFSTEPAEAAPSDMFNGQVILRQQGIRMPILVGQFLCSPVELSLGVRTFRK